MKLVRATEDQLTFQLGKREKELFLTMLGFYPTAPRSCQLTRSTGVPDAKESQKLLEQSLAEQREQNQKQLAALLTDAKRLAPNEHGWRLSLARGDLEWLLQVLNDIRIGHWVALGSPAEPERIINETTAPHLWAMEVAGSFQMGFLEIARRKPGK